MLLWTAFGVALLLICSMLVFLVKGAPCICLYLFALELPLRHSQSVMHGQLLKHSILPQRAVPFAVYAVLAAIGFLVSN